MSKFLDAFHYTLSNEGTVFTDIPQDHGGPTNCGVSKRVFDEFLDEEISIEEFKTLRPENFTEFYNDQFWRIIGGDKIKNQGMATAIFDMAVQFNPIKSVRMAQVACRVMNYTLKLDGLNGDQTSRVLNVVDPNIFLEKFEKIVEMAYERKVEDDPTQEIFIHGWLNRAKRLLTLKET